MPNRALAAAAFAAACFFQPGWSQGQVQVGSVCGLGLFGAADVPSPSRVACFGVCLAVLLKNFGIQPRRELDWKVQGGIFWTYYQL